MGIKERRAREKAQRKDQILAATREILFENGLAGLSVNQIAKRAELSPSALYTYFKNKEDIIFTLAEEGLDRLNQYTSKAIDPSDSPRRRIEQISRAYWDFSREETDYFNIITYFLTSPLPVLSDGLKRITDKKGETGLDLVRDALEEGEKSGDFKIADIRKTMLFFWASLNGVIQFKKLQTTLLEGLEHEALYKYAVDSILDSIENNR